jgi:hypothetical protein
MKRFVVAVSLATVVAACGSSSSTTAPTPGPAPTPPIATTYSLTGTVTSTAGGGIAGATVRILDGANAGKSTTTSASGAYSFTGLAVAGQTVNASATNYSALSKGVSTTTNQTLDFQLAPTPLFARTGVGNTVFDVPDNVLKVRITGIYTGSSTNFVMWLGPQNVACGVVIASGCRLLVNELLGTSWKSTTYDATLLTGNGGTSATGSLTVQLSTGVAWTFTEVR